MNGIEHALIYSIRKYKNTILMVLVITCIFLGQLYGMCLYFNAVESQEKAFEYNGYAMSIEEMDLNQDVIDRIKEIPHVTAVDLYKWYNAQSLQMKAISEDNTYNEITIVTHSQVEVDSWFTNENKVQLLEGEFPTEKNNGILIEQKLAQSNQLSVGDAISFQVEGVSSAIELMVCGIYEVDVEFIVTEQGMEMEDVYRYHPSNRVYANTESLTKLLNEDIYSSTYRNIYIDEYASYDEVQQSIQTILGEDVEISNNADSYLEASTAIVSVMKNLSQTILLYVAIIGAIILLLLITFFVAQYQREMGILMALGYRKSKIILMYFYNMVVMIGISLFLAVACYGATNNLFMNVVDETVIESFNDTVNSGNGPYRMDDFETGFQMKLEPNIVFISDNIVRNIVVILVSVLIISLCIPVYLLYKTKPRILLMD